MQFITRLWHNFWLTLGRNHIQLWVDAFSPPPKTVTGNTDWVWVTGFAEAVDYLTGYVTDRLVLNGDLGLAVATWLTNSPENLPRLTSTRTTDAFEKARIQRQIQKAKAVLSDTEMASPYRPMKFSVSGR